MALLLGRGAGRGGQTFITSVVLKVTVRHNWSNCFPYNVLIQHVVYKSACPRLNVHRSSLLQKANLAAAFDIVSATRT
jgi:hypothetical protein